MEGGHGANQHTGFKDNTKQGQDVRTGLTGASHRHHNQ